MSQNNRGDLSGEDDVSSDLVGLDGSNIEQSSELECEGERLYTVGSANTWKLTNFDNGLTGFHVVADSWGGGGDNLNRVFVKDPTDSLKTVLGVMYPKGTTTPTSQYNPNGKRGGTGFYAEPIAAVILARAKTVSLEYSVFFPADFDFVRGGKLPGLYGGAGTTRGCSGGSTGTGCYSARFMWRRGGDGELYLYTPKSAEQDPEYERIPPFTHRDLTYGDSVARGAVKFVRGAWTKIRVTVGLNSIGYPNPEKDGTVEMHVNGKQVVKFDKMVWRTDPQVTTKGIMFQTFFGGSTADWAATSDTYVLFKDFVMIAE